MSILFLILKIIGILILIPIVLLLILLIFPICYQIEGDFDGKSPKAQVKVSWAVIFLRAKAFYEEELNFGIRIFGIPIYDSRKEHWSVFGEHKKKDKKKHKKRSDSKKKQKNKKNKAKIGGCEHYGVIYKIDTELNIAWVVSITSDIALDNLIPIKKSRLFKTFFVAYFHPIFLNKNNYTFCNVFDNKEEFDETVRIIK